MSTYRPMARVLWTLAVACLCTTTAYASQLSSITVGRFQDFTVVTLFGDAPLTVTHQIVEAKNGKPHRIVVDITGAVHALPTNNFTDLPKGSLTGIRTSQFAVSPESVVRVVMDLAHPAAYRLETPGNTVRVMLSLPGDPPISAVWTSGSGKTLAVTHKAPATKDAKSSADAAKKAAPKTSPAMAATATKTPGAGAKHVAVPKPASSSKSTGIKLADLSDSNKDMPKVPVLMPKKREMPKIDYQLPKPKSTLATTHSRSKSPNAPASAAGSNAKTATATAGPATPAAPKQKVASKGKPVVVASAKPKAGTSAAKKTKAKSAPKKKAKVRNSKAMASAVNATAPKASKAKRSSSRSKPGTARPPAVASAPLASLTTLPPLVRSTPQLVPERNKIAYHTGGRRDPFEALLTIGTGYNSAALPDVGTLRLVGLLHDVKESMGLFEDANGYGYILRKGDRVKNGRLTKLTQTRAFFQLSEFGWSRSVQLNLMKSEG